MKFKQVLANKKQYLDLLLLADENEEMIDCYLDKGDLFILEDKEVVGLCVITNESNGIYEIKNIAISPLHQRKGFGKKIIQFIFEHYKALGAHTIVVGTGESPLTLPFYESCGFIIYDRITDFFTNNYPHPIMEDGVLLKDMVLLKKEI